MAKSLRMRFSLALLATAALVAAAFPALASAGSISGTVTEAAGGSPLQGVQVCADEQTGPLEGHCTSTDASGGYSLSVGAGQYSVHFDDTALDRNLVSQYYGGGPAPLGTLVTLASAAESRTGIDAQLQAGSTITGTVTDAFSHIGVAGLPVCAEVQTFTGPYGRCEHSGPGGAYTINGLAPGKYSVEFQTGSTSYQPQRYKESVEVIGPGETFSAIDAAMTLGVEISGRLTEAGTGIPASRVNVELLWVNSQETADVETDANGNYVLRGLPEAEYVVLFSRPLGPAGADVDCFAPQYYKSASTFSGATVLHGVPGVALTGIDAELVNFCPKSPPPLQVTFAPSTNPVGAPRRPLHCRKGFHRKRVKGKARCVRRHKRHRRHRRHY